VNDLPFLAVVVLQCCILHGSEESVNSILIKVSFVRRFVVFVQSDILLQIEGLSSLGGLKMTPDGMEVISVSIHVGLSRDVT